MKTLKSQCKNCGKQFSFSQFHYKILGFRSRPGKCPACKDREQGRPHVILERKTLFECDVVADGSFAEIFALADECKPEKDDRGARRRTIKGNWYGAIWSGLIDVYSYVWPVQKGTRLRLLYSVVKKEVLRKDDNGEDAQVVEERDYVTLMPCQNEKEPILPSLCYIKAESKLHGHNARTPVTATIVGMPEWFLKVNGKTLSGHRDTEAWIAVVGPRDIISVEMSGGINKKVTYPGQAVGLTHEKDNASDSTDA